ncbi:MAG: cation-transporting P-type ATPase [Nitrospirae bacterium]|nr:cation-transporting P-type ATPase [Nitrospirota bacterium]
MMKMSGKHVDEIFEELSTGVFGLSGHEAKVRLERDGANEIRKKVDTSTIRILFSQFSNILIIILIVAAILSLAFGQRSDAIVLLCIILLNSGVGFLQEYKASKAIESLRNMISPVAAVVRDGQFCNIKASEVVVGDILVLSEGDKVAADARIFEENELKADESLLTGESLPRRKTSGTTLKSDLLAQDQRNMVFMGTGVAHGNARAVVVATGMRTEFGRIAGLTQETEEEPSPLQKELMVIGRITAKVTVVISIGVIALGLFKGQDFLYMFFFAISIAVAVVPEGLPTTMTISLAMALQKMARKNAIVRRLSSVETLGATTVICSDKTGTITKNQMTVKTLITNGRIIEATGAGYEPAGEFLESGNRIDPADSGGFNMLLNIAALCNNARLVRQDGAEKDYAIAGDPTEGALIVAAAKAGIDRDALEKQYERIHEMPFDSEKKRMITIHSHGGHHYAFAKGAPDEIMRMCNRILADGNEPALDAETVARLAKHEEDMGRQALRVLGFAYKKLSPEASMRIAERDFIFAGFMGMIDPPRAEIAGAVRVCKDAGIKINIITGDYGATAKAVAMEVGIANKSTAVITGVELEKMNDTRLEKILRSETIFARVSPSHKLRIVSLLQDMGEVVAVTGDGVNDAPALKKASIGVAMGIAGTEVSKESSDMVLLDDSFATIVTAIREGRKIYDNLSKLVYYNFAGITGELFTVVAAVMIGLFYDFSVLPLLAIQILLIDLGVEVLPSLALAMEPEEKGLMTKTPRNPSARIVDKRFLKRIGVSGLLIASGALMLFYRELASSGWKFGDSLATHEAAYVKATTMAFFTLVMFQMFNAFNSKTITESLLKTNPLGNKYLVAAVAVSIAMMMAFSYIPFLNGILHTAPLSAADWLLITAVSSTILIVEEVRKYMERRSGVYSTP